jgi:tripartite-type tricarboxylate transporter receptor subunit TctC
MFKIKCLENSWRVACPAALAMSLGLLPLGATAQSDAATYPSRPIRIVVPQSPGASTDLTARLIAQKLTEVFKQTVIVDNRPGAGTTSGTEIVVRAAPDGHTLLVVASSLTINPSLYAKLPYDPVRDFSGVTLLASGALLIAVHPSLPVRNTKELIALARTKPGQLTYATASVIGGQRLAGELFKDAAKVDIVNVPYNGGAPATMATVGGHTTMLVTNVIEAAPQVQSGKLRGIAVTTIERSAVVPEIPTVAEAGFAGFDASNWFGTMVRSGTPRAAIDRLSAEIGRALEQPEVRDMLLKMGLKPAPMTPDQFSAFVRKETERTGRIVKMLNLKME